MDFLYDANGRPYAFYYNGTLYYYVLNLQGDVIQLLDSSGSLIANYSYDAWGKVTVSDIASGYSAVANANPLRYRGYYYDTETGFYYLQSRYYDPAICRFINADAFASTGQDVLGCNMFAYCMNNPVNMFDEYGNLPVLTTIAIVGVAASALIGGVVAGVSTVMSGGSAGEIAASAFVGAVTAGGIATAAALGAAGSLTVGTVAAISAGIGAAGEVASISIEHAFHHNDDNYSFNWGVAVARTAYAAGMGALSGSISYGINKVFIGSDEIFGFGVSTEAAVALGATDFGMRQVIPSVISSTPKPMRVKAEAGHNQLAMVM